MVDVDELVAAARVVRLPMRVRFRGITAREAVVFEGPAGWGEFGPFPEYDDAEAAHWLRAGIEAAYQGFPVPLRDAVPVNATVPAVGPSRVPEVLARFPGCRVAKVKVAETGQTLAQDVARVAAVRAAMPGAAIRVDANGGWTVDQAERALTRLLDGGPLDYAEQPCATVEELAEVRRRLPDVPIAADESIRRASDPMRVVRACAADIAVLKVAPLGGVAALLDIASRIGMPAVISSALDSAVGIGIGLRAAAALPVLEHACGLGTGGFFVEDVAQAPTPEDGYLPVSSFTPDPARLATLAAPTDRRDWWRRRVADCYPLLNR